MKRLVLHIGTSKTGTTAIQSFLYNNRERLKKERCGIPVQTGVYFRPDGGRQDQTRNGHFLIPLARVSPPISNRDGGLKTAKRDAEAFRKIAARFDTVALSDEGLAWWISQGNGFCPSLKNVLAGFGADHPKIIVYLRRQDHHISSYYCQKVKSMEPLGFLTFEEFTQSPRIAALSNYNAWLSDLEHTFGIENVTIRRYDRSFFPDGDICRDFCAAAGISWNEDFELPKAVNPSLSLDVIELKRLFNALPSYQNSHNFLKWSAIHASEVFPDSLGTSLFSPEEAAELLARHAEGNRAIAERHFGGEPLFNEDVSGLVKWRRDESRLLNAAILLFADALAEQRATQVNSLSLSRYAKWLAGKLPAPVSTPLKRALAFWRNRRSA